MNYNLTSKGLLLSNNNSCACVKILRRYFFRETAAYNKLNYILLLFAKQKFFKNASHGSFAGDKALWRQVLSDVPLVQWSAAEPDLSQGPADGLLQLQSHSDVEYRISNGSPQLPDWRQTNAGMIRAYGSTTRSIDSSHIFCFWVFLVDRYLGVGWHGKPTY